MRKFGWFVAMSMGLLLSAVGCGDSDSSNGGGSGGSAGSGGTAGSGGGGTMVTVSGMVSAASLTGPSTAVGGATVSIPGGDSTTSDPDGSFMLQARVGTVMFLATAEGNWGSFFAENVPAGGRSDLEVEVIPDALVGEVAAAVGAAPDTSKGLVAVFFDETTTMGGESASINVNSELSFIFDADEEPVEGDTLEAGGGSDVIFLNTNVASSVTATAVNASSQPCPLEFPSASYSVQAKVFTEIDVYCP